MANDKGTCFVVMGFGKKTDFETGRTLDLDKSYQNLIKPAVEAAGLKCIRADEIVHSGLIDVPMYEQLLKADVVVADLSTSNKNAFYELGIRHALRPYTTVIIAEDGIKAFPFDINHVVIRQYHHMGEDIGFSEVMRFRTMLTQAITEIMEKTPNEKLDSPVYTFLKGLKAPELAAIVQEAVIAQEAVQQAVANAAQNEKTAAAKDANQQKPAAANADMQSHHALMQKVDDAQKKGDWVTAKTLLGAVRDMMKTPENKDKEDHYILQKLALYTYKSESPNEEEALDEACKLLRLLKPETSNDPETLGLWGAVHKRLWEANKKMANLDESIRAYERGFYLRNDHYNGINYAFLLNIRANKAPSPAEAITDFVQAARVRKEVLDICEQWLKENPEPRNEADNTVDMQEYRHRRYWVEATMAEAYIGRNEKAKGEDMLKRAFDIVPATWMKETTEEQLAKLKPLLEDSPLKFINKP